ncbi:TetR/AcrR family transcriptional regulator [Oceanicaulis sp. UBA2681]|uniref:TetR/AcrR family transcriptional regulator n=1 Tax=Oceanicaulis sp. UBA2681 TaxID=1947007 RepID=UPI00257CB4EA|nr:TetR/AcrR family transcriptional regulator [Oceanicaulis sp. UBA2681]|tara:strand:- start:2670 stop:3266 length:597 start_codon:yes stop_codon:yes gene_type:complete
MAATADTRTRILNACHTLLVSDTGASTRMSDIAKAAGLSRQAVYLHFKTRAELLIALTRHIDEVEDVTGRLAPSRAATSGLERLDAYIEAWGGYIPIIYPVARALMAMAPSDEAADLAWTDRMTAMRQGCDAAIHALAADGDLRPELDAQKAADLLWAILSVRNWEALTLSCGWPQAQYLHHMKALTRNYLCSKETAS